MTAKSQPRDSLFSVTQWRRLCSRVRYEAWRLTFKFNSRFRPIKLAPEFLAGYDGEPPYWLRADLASCAEEVPAALARELGISVSDFDADGMDSIDGISLGWYREMAVPDEGFEEGGQWESVDKTAQGAVPYWWWSD